MTDKDMPTLASSSAESSKPETGTPEFLHVDSAPIAMRYREGDKKTGIVWLGGYCSDMLGTKAAVLDQWAAQNNHAMLRFDYSGHGESGGDFHQGTISRWLNESLAVFDHFAKGPQILVGSSMGGWIALRMVQELKKRNIPLAGLLLIAPAPDFTAELIEPELTQNQKDDLAEKGYFEEPSDYSPQPYIYTRALIEDGRNNLVLNGIIETTCPVHILQGMQDESVPHAHALRLMEHLPVDDVTLTYVKDGDHRLSRPQDLDLITRSLAALVRRASSEM